MNRKSGTSALALFLSIFVFILLFTQQSAAQDYFNGFYFTVPCTKNGLTARPVVLTEDRTFVCVTAQPIVEVNELQAVSNLREIPEENIFYFEVTITKDVASKLFQVTSLIKSKKLALIVDNEIIFVFDAMDDGHINRTFLITGQLQEMKVNRTHDKLVKLTKRKEVVRK
jgi:hypothetical protein